MCVAERVLRYNHLSDTILNLTTIMAYRSNLQKSEGCNRIFVDEFGKLMEFKSWQLCKTHCIKNRKDSINLLSNGRLVLVVVDKDRYRDIHGIIRLLNIDKNHMFANPDCKNKVLELDYNNSTNVDIQLSLEVLAILWRCASKIAKHKFDITQKEIRKISNQLV